jgi:hypothetical protein
MTNKVSLNFARQKFRVNLNIHIDKDLNNYLKNLSLRTNRSVSSIVRKTLYKIFLNKEVQ